MSLASTYLLAKSKREKKLLFYLQPKLQPVAIGPVQPRGRPAFSPTAAQDAGADVTGATSIGAGHRAWAAGDKSISLTS